MTSLDIMVERSDVKEIIIVTPAQSLHAIDDYMRTAVPGLYGIMRMLADEHVSFV